MTGIEAGAHMNVGCKEMIDGYHKRSGLVFFRDFFGLLVLAW